MNQKKYELKFIKTAIILMALFLIISILLFTNKIVPFDNYIYESVANLISPNLTYIIKFITNLAGFWVLIAITIILLIINQKIGYYTLINLSCIMIINQFLKLVVMRPRPISTLRLINQNGYSFPSGHAMAATAFYGLLIYLLLKSNHKYKLPLSILISLLIIIIGLSRIYLGVHYASDIIGGMIISMLWLIIFINLNHDKILANKKK